MKDIKIVNMRAIKKNTEDYAVICSGFSMRHLYSTAKTLVRQMKALGCDDIKVLPTISGTKDDSWLLVTIKEVQVHFILADYRDELDLEFRWMNPPPPEMKKKWKMYQNLKKKGNSLQVDENTFAIDGEEEEDYFK
uniref:Uncharacterized protein n=1 Tax=Strombidium rassoulzadegani TaxID=1082188 RepID=A0A7S3FUW0_9SPIT|mmetsp:Transcript_3109/g.5226  ORF Transcript_3109/g.5226 Transcript_3109/m.5226 type:complete len:136 (+) Transcript_3109:282-689(+)